MDTESGNPCGTFEVVLAMYLRVVDAAMAVTDASVEDISVFISNVELVPMSRIEVVDLVAVVLAMYPRVVDAAMAVIDASVGVFAVVDCNMVDTVELGPVSGFEVVDLVADAEAVLVFGVTDINVLVKDGPVPNPGKIDVAQDV